MTTRVVVLVGSTTILEDEDKGEEDESDDRPKNDLKNDISSDVWRVSTSGVLLDELEDVEDIGAVAFVTIWRLTCRGK